MKTYQECYIQEAILALQTAIKKDAEGKELIMLLKRAIDRILKCEE